MSAALVRACMRLARDSSVVGWTLATIGHVIDLETESYLGALVGTLRHRHFFRAVLSSVAVIALARSLDAATMSVTIGFAHHRIVMVL